MFVNFLGVPGILILVYLGGPWFLGFVTVVALMALYEFYRLVGHKGVSPHVGLGLLTGTIIMLFYYGNLYPKLATANWQHLLIVFILIVGLLELFRGKEHPTANITYTLAGILYVPLLIGTMVTLRNIESNKVDLGFHLTLVLFVCVWTCDSAAYLFGKKWGEVKILIKVSPKKTWVGGIAGLISAVTVAAVFFLTDFFPLKSITLTDSIIIGAIVGIFGQAGDFIESLMKRDAGVKDSGSFLLGHGGVLDRFDSLIVATPLIFLYYIYMIAG